MRATCCFCLHDMNIHKHSNALLKTFCKSMCKCFEKKPKLNTLLYVSSAPANTSCNSPVADTIQYQETHFTYLYSISTQEHNKCLTRAQQVPHKNTASVTQEHNKCHIRNTSVTKDHKRCDTKFTICVTYETQQVPKKNTTSVTYGTQQVSRKNTTSVTVQEQSKCYTKSQVLHKNTTSVTQEHNK